MPQFRYALVAYVNDPVGDFINKLRRELHPHLPHLPAHLTFLPPRVLQASENEALAAVEAACENVEPFEVNLAEVESFIPVTPTVFIRVAHAYRMRELHDRLGRNPVFSGQEEWPYLPHMTIVKMSSEERAQEAYLLARHRWAEYEGRRCVLVKELTLVQERDADCWVDIAGFPLGRSLVSPQPR